MRARSGAVVMVAIATMLLGVHTGVATANRLSLLNAERGFRMTWSSLNAEFGGWGTASCPVTLEGTFSAHSLNKRAGTLIGQITRGTCNGTGDEILTATLPWEVRYASFEGTLPNITGITLNVLGAAIFFHTNLISCLIRSESARPLLLIVSLTREGAMTSVQAGYSRCETLEMRMEGTGAVTGQGEAAAPAFHLI